MADARGGGRRRARETRSRVLVAAPRRGRGRRCGVDRDRAARLVPADPLPAALRGDRPDARAELRPAAGAPRRGHLHGEQVRRDRARSDAGAVGLMQLLPDTAKGIAVRTGGTRVRRRRPARPRDQRPLRLVVPPAPPRTATTTTCTALAAYHAGQGNVDEWRREGVGIQFPETRAYVEKRARRRGRLRGGLRRRARSGVTGRAGCPTSVGHLGCRSSRDARRVAHEAEHELALRRVEAERALGDDPVDHHAEELADVLRRDVRAELARPTAPVRSSRGSARAPPAGRWPSIAPGARRPPSGGGRTRGRRRASRARAPSRPRAARRSRPRRRAREAARCPRPRARGRAPASRGTS